jgi:hypothetical protein
LHCRHLPYLRNYDFHYHECNEWTWLAPLFGRLFLDISERCTMIYFQIPGLGNLMEQLLISTSYVKGNTFCITVENCFVMHPILSMPTCVGLDVWGPRIVHVPFARQAGTCETPWRRWRGWRARHLLRIGLSFLKTQVFKFVEQRRLPLGS